jgi:hypothetical protein
MTPELTLSFNIALFLFNGVLGIAMWLLKTSYAEVKEQLKQNSQAIDNVKDHYFKKEDFKDFKDELWKRFDRLEDRMNGEATK